ncbi:ABC transporter permease [Acidisoma cellulosilytica]|uniref:ABC transporter permease n=1 Tax=Acidisoma cellulosilyticum TaxID=2802395 RepID=A0A963Z6M4_9PROT|nr:ABC transporter permease [Acidisoma cellulosilyticum]MCB8882818.1 ABC transporter permease [Acidisoma cellulosilyticum]
MRARLLAIIRAIAFIALALILCGIIFEASGFSAPDMFSAILDGAFLSDGALIHDLRWACPLFVSATGVVVAFRCGYFNVGTQGQFYLGGVGATVAVALLPGLPAVIVTLVAILAGIGFGALWAFWPGWLRIRSGTDEVITTLMGNFIAGLLLVWVTSGPLKDPSGSGQVTSSPPVPLAIRLSTDTGVSVWILALTVLVGVVTWVLVNRTAFGVLGGLAGRNPVMVTWQGARLSRLGLGAFLFSGATAGLAGAMEVLGPDGRLVSGFSPAHGFTAVLIALVANLSVSGSVIVALFFGGLASASLYLPVIAGLPSAAIDMVNAAIALFITSRAMPGWLRLPRRNRS